MTTTPPSTPAEPGEPAPSTTPEPLETAATAPDQADAPDVDKRRKDPAAEAAGYRTKLRETESDRDGLRDQLSAARRQNVEQLIDSGANLRGDDTPARTLIQADDLWSLLGANPDQFYDETGALDKAGLAKFIDEKTKGRDYMTHVKNPPRVILPFGAASASMSRPRPGLAGGTPADWQTALKPGAQN